MEETIVKKDKLVNLYPSTKFFYPLFVTISIFLIPHYLYGYMMLPLSIILAYIGGKGKEFLKLSINVLFFLVFFIFIMQAVIAPGEEIIWSYGFLEIKREGVKLSLILTSRIVAIASSFLLFFRLTSIKDISRSLEKAGVSPKLSYAIISVFQFIPEIRTKSKSITDAQKSRGIETEGNLKTRMKAFIPILGPLVLSSILSTEEKAITLESRGFSIKGRKTSLYEIEKQAVDYVIQFLFISILAVLLIGRFFIWN